ncbi:SusC/RagA family TonB-linked outer membrane protein [Niabella insulamsoli]|uniref:SusC/RagA family TonB-linked outer membrane protein n=1 Tax=Niabella insulamsoli TaxID=3144874 RepID=UPI0031FCF9B3
MKCTLVIILLASLQSIAFNGSSQELVSVNVKSKSLAATLKSIEANYPYRFVYSDSVALSNYKVTLNASNITIENMMNRLLNNTAFTYKKMNKNLVVIMAAMPQKQAQYLVSGIVTDSTGAPIAGANVLEKGTSNGTVTNADGSFTLDVSGKSAILEISRVGFLAREIAVSGNNLGTIILKTSSQQMEDVIVIGYGTTTRKDAVGAVDQIKASQFEDRPVGNVTQALQGAAPSLVIQQRSMNPNGNDMNINIRGISTMNSNSPLIVIDGLITDGASLNQLNPSDIQSVSVLKDAGSAAIYGSRSSNGIILVTTKRGAKNQKPTVSLSGQVGWQDPKILFSPVQGYQNATLKNLALTNVGSQPEFSPDQIQDLYEHRDEEEWNFYQILEPALQQTYNLRVSGGSQNTTYLFSGGYFNQGSNFVGDYGITRYNLRSNITTEVGRFKLTSIVAYSRNNANNTTATNAIINSSRIPPYYYYRMQADNGKYLINNALTDQNPIGELHQGGFINDKNDYINLNLNLEVKLFSGLKLKGVVGSDIYANNQFTRRIEFPLYASADATQPALTMNSNRQTSDYSRKASLMNYQLMFDYNKTFGRHNLSGLLGASNESFTAKESRLTYLYTDSILGIPTTGTVIDEANSYLTPNRTVQTSLSSLFGRLGYSFDDTYYAELSFRYDGSSKFAKQNRWGFFPSATLAWRLTNEAFMDRYKSNVGDLKLRASYGVLGNQNIGDYQYLTRYSLYPNSYVSGDSSFAGAGFVYGNEDLRWESTHNTNIGVDATFLRNRLTVSFDYFYKLTKDILVRPVIPSVFGTDLDSYNVGEMKNQGWEVNIGYRFNTGAFSHNVLANMGDSRNEVTKFEGFEQISIADNIGKLTRIGVPFNAYYGLKTDGYFQSMQEIETAALPVGVSATDLKPGDVKYVDRNNDGVIDSKDRFILGYGFPRYTFGLTYNVAFKGLDLSMLWQGVAKRDMMIRGELVEPFHENYSYVIYQHQLDYWTQTNTDARWPRLTATGSPSRQNNYGRGSDLYKFDGSYARLKNIQVGYTLPASLSEKAGIKKARLYINAQNLITLSKQSWIDPESSEFNSNMSGAANSARNYPTLRYYGFGLDLQF